MLFYKKNVFKINILHLNPVNYYICVRKGVNLYTFIKRSASDFVNYHIANTETYII